MTALSENGQFKPAGTAEWDTGGDADLTQRKLRPCVGGKCRINGRIFQNPVLLNQGTGATSDFLPGLKNKFDGSRKLVPQAAENHGSSQKPCGVGIVAAGVHATRYFGTEGNIHLLLYGKGINICPQKYTSSRAFSPI